MARFKPYIEWLIWIGIALVAYIQTGYFDQDIAQYKFGADGWPVAICLGLVLGASGQLINHISLQRSKSLHKNADASEIVLLDDSNQNSEIVLLDDSNQNSEIVLLDDSNQNSEIVLLDDSNQNSEIVLYEDSNQNSEIVLYEDSNQNSEIVLLDDSNQKFDRHRQGWRRLQRIAIFVLPFVYLYLSTRLGAYVTTPLFLLAFLYLLEVRPVPMICVTLTVYALVLIIFTRLFYVALPAGRIEFFYDLNIFLISLARVGM